MQVQWGRDGEKKCRRALGYHGSKGGKKEGLALKSVIVSFSLYSPLLTQEVGSPTIIS